MKIIICFFNILILASCQENVPDTTGDPKGNTLGTNNYLISVSSIDELADYKDRPPIIYLSGRTSPGDGGEGMFTWKSSNLSAKVQIDKLSGIYVAPISDPTGAKGAWVRQHSDKTINAKWFGAKGDNKTDDTDAINGAVSYFKEIEGGATLTFPEGIYVTTGVTIKLDKPNRTITGEGKFSTTLKGVKIVFIASDCMLTKLKLYGNGTGIGVRASDPKGARRRSIVSECRISNYDIGILQDDAGAFFAITDTHLDKNISVGIKLDSYPYAGRGDVLISRCQINGSIYGLRIKSIGTATISGGTKIQGNGKNVWLNTIYPKVEGVSEGDRIRQVYFDSASIEDATGTFQADIATFEDGGNIGERKFTRVTLKKGGKIKMGENSRANITGNEDYNGQYIIKNVDFKLGKFTIEKEFVSGNTTGGKFVMPEWDVHIQASEAAGVSSIDDIFFTNGDTNNVLLDRGMNIQFYGGTIKRLRWVSAAMKNVSFIGGTHVESHPGYIPVSGTAKNVYTASFNNSTFQMSYVTSGEVALDNDTATSITPSKNSGMILVKIVGQDQKRTGLMTYATTGSGGTTALLLGSLVTCGHGILTGKTGADQKLNVYSSNDGKIYIENRTGKKVTISYAFFL